MKKYTAVLFLFLFIAGCAKKQSTDPQPFPLEEGGLFVMNQGNFTYANASLSFYNPIQKTTKLSVFYSVNGVPLGDVAQSMTIQGDTAYLVINNSGFIYSVNRHTGAFIGKISGFQSPRQVLFVAPQKAYVSDLYADYLTVVSPLTTEFIQHIPLGRSSESMVMVSDKVFVAHWSDYNQSRENNQIMVVDPMLDIVVDSIQVGKEPNSMVVDGHGMLWVLCSGGYMNQEKPSLWKIDPVTLSVINTLQFEETVANPSYLNWDASANRLLYLNKGVYQVDIDSPVLSTSPFIEEANRNFYALYVTNKEGIIYVSDAGNYLSKGLVYRYNASGDETDSFEAGIIPGAFLSNESN